MDNIIDFPSRDGEKNLFENEHAFREALLGMVPAIADADRHELDIRRAELIEKAADFGILLRSEPTDTNSLQ